MKIAFSRRTQLTKITATTCCKSEIVDQFQSEGATRSQAISAMFKDAIKQITSNEAGLPDTVKLTYCYYLPADATWQIMNLFKHIRKLELYPIGLVFENPNPQPYYTWELKEFEGVLPARLKQQYPEQIAQWERTGRVPAGFSDIIYNYNRIRIQKTTEANYFQDWHLIEAVQRQMLEARCDKFNCVIPSKKVYNTFIAKQQHQAFLDREIVDIEFNDKLVAYDLDIQELYIKYTPVKTKQGWALKFEEIYNIDQTDYPRIKDKRYNIQGGYEQKKIPYDILEECYPQKVKNVEGIKTIKAHLEFLKKYGDEFLAPDWKRCPVCNELYNIHSGCEDHVEAIEFVQAPNLLYGNTAEWDDLQLEDLTSVYDPEEAQLWENEEYEEYDTTDYSILLPSKERQGEIVAELVVFKTIIEPKCESHNPVVKWNYGSHCSKCTCTDCVGCMILDTYVGAGK